MHVGIVELYEKNHHSLLYNWVQVANINDWNITIFTSAEIYNHISKELEGMSYDIMIYEDSILKSISKIKNYYKHSRIDLLLFTSLTGNIFPLLFHNLTTIKYGITIHNANTWIKQNTIRKPRHLLKRYIRYKIRKNALFLIVGSDNIKRHIENNYNIKTPVFIMPFSLKKGQKKININDNNSGLNIIYPGSININRKLYDNFLKLAANNPKDNFIILGKADYKNENNIKILNKASQILNVKIFEEYVSVEDFTNYMSKADLLYSEINVDFKNSDFTEIYGVTKDSGISYLMYEYELPALLNNSFNNLPHVNDGTVYFSDFRDLETKYAKLQSASERKNIIYALRKNLKSLNILDVSKNLKVIEKMFK